MLFAYRQQRTMRCWFLTDKTENNTMLLAHRTTMQVAYRQHREQPDASSLQTGQKSNEMLFNLLTDNTDNEMLVAYTHNTENNEMLLFTDRTESNKMLVAPDNAENNDMLLVYKQNRKTRCEFLTNMAENNKVHVCYKIIPHSSAENKEMLPPYKWTENDNMPFACRQHREQGDASSLQTGPRTVKFKFLEAATDNNEMLVAY